MSRLILATCINEGYYSRAKPYLKSVEKYSQIDNICLTLDFLPECTDRIDYYHVDSTRVRLPLNNYCLQHGEFLDWVDTNDDDVILFTDADLRMQRPFTDDELNWMRSFKTGQISCGYNAGPLDTLAAEAQRLGMRCSMTELSERYGNLIQPCYNVGVTVARRDTWERLCNIYVDMYPDCQPLFHHVASQQWLLSWIMDRYLDVQIMPQTFHTHGHYALPKGTTFKGSEVWFDGQKVLFRHKIGC